MKRILIIGSDHTAALEHIYLKHLLNLGNIVELYPIQDYFLSYYSRNYFNKIVFRLGLSSIYHKLNKAVKLFVTTYQPTHIIVFKGMELFPSSLLEWKKSNIKIINYNPDNPFIFSGRGSGNHNVTNCISLFDLYCSYDKGIVLQLKQKGINAALIPFGFELSDQWYNQIVSIPEINRLCFIGNPDNERASFIKALLKEKIPIDIFGSGWEKYFPSSSPLINLYQSVYGIDFWKTLRTYTIQLNLMRVHNLDSHNMRSFDIPGVGGIMLAPNTPDHIQYFEVGKEIFVFDTITDCINKIKFLLELTINQRNGIRAAAYLKSKNYTYSQRVYWFDKLLNEL